MLVRAVFVASALAALAPGAYARSAICYSGTGASGYSQGHQVEEAVIDYLFEHTFNSECTEMESFIDAVNIPFNPDAPSSPFLLCRNEGVADGLADAISDITWRCVGECLDNGSQAGQFAAQQYCGVHMYAQQSAPALRLCDFTATQACQVALTSYVNDNCYGKKLSDGDFDTFVSIACQY